MVATLPPLRGWVFEGNRGLNSPIGYLTRQKKTGEKLDGMDKKSYEQFLGEGDFGGNRKQEDQGQN